jgi:hypothetical protein
MIGTHKPAGAAAGVVHEGYGGWTWAAFASALIRRTLSRVTKEQPVRVRGRASRLRKLESRGISPNAGECAGLHHRHAGDQRLLRLQSDDAKQLDLRIDGVFKEADKLIAEFRRAAPHATIGVCLTTPGNSRDAAFVANYKDRYTLGLAADQHRLVERQ